LSGGRLADLGDGTILLTIGDHALNEVNSSVANVAQDPSADYGKTMRIDVMNRSAEVYSTGHRNPQGVHLAPDGRIWLTEHGPRGGDELNLLVRNVNYGWPLVTYGAAEGRYIWPLNTAQGRNAGYTRPVFSWLPSIGVSSLISVRQGLFGLWKNDLLVSSLRGATLFRVRLEDDHVAYTEPIVVGRRIRDVAEAADGRIVLLLDDGGFGWIEPVPSGTVTDE
jgi:glucose/arabinose dehydrogenase